MFPSKALFTLVLAALSVGGSLATPVPRDASKTTLRFSTRFNSTGGSLAAKDRARAQALIQNGIARANGNSTTKRSTSFGVTNDGVTYIASVGVGSPATNYDLLIDTGSSNTWVGAGQAYVKTSTSKATGDDVSVSYGSGEFSGKEYLDTVTLASGLVITQQSIGVATSSSGFSGVDGILGIGPTDLTEDTVSGVDEVPTVSDNLYTQGTISTEVVGIFYAPTTSDDDANGELTFGGTDSSKYTSSISYVPLTTTSPASEYWGINQEVKYGSTTVLSETAGIVDTGTTLVLLATSAFDKYIKATGGKYDEDLGVATISSADYEKLDNLDFVIGGQTYALTPNAQIWPRSLNSELGGNSDDIYLIVSDLGSDIGEGLDFINGYTFLERFYSVFDTTNGQVGFATTSYTDATTN